MKRKMLEGFPPDIRKRVLCVLDLPCPAHDDNALRQAAEQARSFIDGDQCRYVDEAVTKFMELLHSDEDSCCYGEMQTTIALQMGAVEQLLVNESWMGSAHTLTELRNIAEAQGTSVIEVKPHRASGAYFCKSFGVGGRLRWQLNHDVLENDLLPPTENYSDDACIDSCVAGERRAPMPLCQGAIEQRALPVVQVQTPEKDDCVARYEIFAWLQERLVAALGDADVADALLAGVEVILADEAEGREGEVLDGWEDQRVSALADTLDMLRGEGVPEDVVQELERRWTESSRLYF